jgi:large subunit ribosomal protein L3
MTGLLGKKVGMTRFFDAESGKNIPVTVIQTGTNTVHQIKTAERDGYGAVQLGLDVVSGNSLSKPRAGHFKKLGSEPTTIVREFGLEEGDKEIKAGQKVGVEVLEGTKFVDVIGISKGRGFAGTVKKYNFMLGRHTHGNKNYRERGSSGANTFPARVFPGLRMAGQYGARQVTAKRLEVVGLDKEMGLVFVKGAIPGARSGVVCICKNTVNK